MKSTNDKRERGAWMRSSSSSSLALSLLRLIFGSSTESEQFFSSVLLRISATIHQWELSRGAGTD